MSRFFIDRPIFAWVIAIIMMLVGIISMRLWTLILIVSLKYVVLLLRADNKGEGGTLSLLMEFLQIYLQ